MSRTISAQCLALKFPLFKEIHLSSYKSSKTFTSLMDQMSDDFFLREEDAPDDEWVTLLDLDGGLAEDTRGGAGTVGDVEVGGGVDGRGCIGLAAGDGPQLGVGDATWGATRLLKEEGCDKSHVVAGVVMGGEDTSSCESYKAAFMSSV
ncbi:hypothetical protein L7F22_011085 [Adiantum nelumboides]|nr:hypothetical protein [Adiantum nelumboides]